MLVSFFFFFLIPKLIYCQYFAFFFSSLLCCSLFWFTLQKGLLRCPWAHKSCPLQIVLDQSSVINVDVLWESQLEYYMGHGDWERVSKLLDLIPEHSLADGSLQVSLDSPQAASTVGFDIESSKHRDYLCALEELDAVCMYVPNIKILRLPANIMGSTWLKMQLEKKLAKKLIFSKEFWEGTEEILPLLAGSGFITSLYNILTNNDFVESSSDPKFSDGGSFHLDTVEALHRVVVWYCVQCNLPCLLDLYLDKHMLVLDNGSLSSLQDAAVSS